MFNHIKLKTKIIILVATSLIGMVTLVWFSAFSMKSDLVDARKTQIKSIVETAYGIAANFESMAKEGKLSREQAQKQAIESISQMKYGGKDGKAEYVYVHRLDGVTVFHVKPEMIGVDNREKIKDSQGRYTLKDMIAALQNSAAAYVDTAFPRPGTNVPVEKLQYVTKLGTWEWLIGTGVYMDDVDAEFRERLTINLTVASIILFLVAGLGFVISRGVLRQVGGEPEEAIALMSRAASGDLMVEVRSAPSGSMLASLAEMVSSIRRMVQEISRNANQLREGSESISQASQEVAAASQKQSDATQSMASAIEEMTVSINHISDSARESQTNSSSSVSLSIDGQAKADLATREITQIETCVVGASQKIKALEEHANQISSIVGVIKEIADQTNLLALNAAIEAARAGETGRGFAVVADEVRKLAERTTTATAEIGDMIRGIQSGTADAVMAMEATLPQVASGVQAATGAAQALSQIKAGAQTTLERIREVADSTKEQSIASDSIAQRVEEISLMVDETSAAMRSNAETAVQMEKISAELNTLVKRFRH